MNSIYFLNFFYINHLIVYFENDTNSDHRISFNATNIATRPVNNSIKNVLCCEIPSSSEWRFTEVFKPNLFVDIKSTIQDKVKSFNCYYKTEGRPFPFPRCEDGLKVLARYRGMQSGLNYAEAFKIIRSQI